MSSRRPPATPNQLLLYFQQSPWLANAYMDGAVQPTLDGTFKWPIVREFRHIEYTAVAGDNIVRVLEPEPEYHYLIAHAWCGIPPLGLGGVGRSACWIQSSIIPVDVNNITISYLGDMSFDAQHAMVGANSQPAVPAAGLNRSTTGPRPVYVPYPHMFMHAFIAAAGGETVFIDALWLRAPMTQPFSTVQNL